MRTSLPGISGSLFPSRYLVDSVAGSPAGTSTTAAGADRTIRRLERWWRRVTATCGPATNLRALFDLAAMPLAGQLGFRARDVVFDPGAARVYLETPRQTPVALLIRRWAERPSASWRDAADAARRIGADWCFVLAPPYLSLVDARGYGLRRAIDFRFPDVLRGTSVPAFFRLASARSFDEDGGRSFLAAVVADAAAFQDRVRTDLQLGVVEALGALAPVLGPAAARGPGSFDEALTLVYRVLFLLFAESRDLVPRDHPIYKHAYLLGSLCRQALTSGAAPGLWDGLAAITRLSRDGCRSDALIVAPFNGHLFARAAAPTLEQSSRRMGASRKVAARDAALRKTLVALATRPGRAGRELITYADLGVEQLGAVYERVLDIGPRSSVAGPQSSGPARHGGRHSAARKQTGTFYTPQPLAEFVVRRTLAPLVSGAGSEAILRLRVLDPAMGSGAFLVAACRYLAQAYERAVVEEGRYGERDLDDDVRAQFRRQIAQQCLAGVDTNPTAVQLARLSLWLTTLARGKPLSFLDHRLRVGNSLIGASPDELRRITTMRRGRSRDPLPLLRDEELDGRISLISRPLLDLLRHHDDSIDAVKEKEAAWAALTGPAPAMDPLGRLRLAASLWCARWFWPGAPSPQELRAAIDALLKSDRMLSPDRLTGWIEIVRSIERQQRFFHWPIEFADVFYDQAGHPRALPGFDAVIGNPPWEMLRKETASGSSPRPLIRFIRDSGLYRSCDRGHMNLYQPFLERSLALARPGGRVGLVLPWGLAADDGASQLRERLVRGAATDTIVGFDNASGMFPIHRGLRFLVVTTSPGLPPREIRARFGVRTGAELEDLPASDDDAGTEGPAYPVQLTETLIKTVGGSRLRIPDVRRPHDLVELHRIARMFPPLGHRDGWHAQFGRELNVTDDRDAFGSKGLPIVEGKNIQPFRLTADGVARRITLDRARHLLPDRRFECARLAYRDVAGVGNRLSLIAAVLPANVVTTHTLFCLRTAVPLEQQHFLCGVLNSYVVNSIVRLLMGGHVTTGLVEDLPVPVWRGTAQDRTIARLSRSLARPGREGGPRAGYLQALVARLYRLTDEAFREVLAGFPLIPQAERDFAMEAFRKLRT